MDFRKRVRLPTNWAAPLLLTAAIGCSELFPAGPRAALSPGESAEFFAAAVGYFAADTMTPLPVWVDPRPLRAEAGLRSVTEADLLQADAQTIALRTRVIESAGWRTTDAPEDWRCVFSQMLPPAQPRVQEGPDSLRLLHEACRRKGAYQSLVFGLPQSGTNPDHPERWRMRSMRMLLNGYEVVDLFLAPGPNGEWVVVEAQVRSGIFS
jgi:hypothetical protein